LSCLGVQVVLITTSAFYRQQAFGEHSSLQSISLLLLFMRRKLGEFKKLGNKKETYLQTLANSGRQIKNIFRKHLLKPWRIIFQ